MAQDKQNDGKYYEVVRLIGSEALNESDAGGDGGGTATFTQTVYFVHVYNADSSVLEISAGGITRKVPGGGSSYCEFPAGAASFSIVAGGVWIARACK